jgi:hypothetical protein
LQNQKQQLLSHKLPPPTASSRFFAISSNFQTISKLFHLTGPDKALKPSTFLRTFSFSLHRNYQKFSWNPSQRRITDRSTENSISPVENMFSWNFETTLDVKWMFLSVYYTPQLRSSSRTKQTRCSEG